MAVEGPFLAALVSRMPDATQNLAAYGVAYAFALVAEGPVIMLLSASTRLARSPEAYRALHRFSIAICALVTLLFALFLLPDIFLPVATRLIGLSTEVASSAHQALLPMLLWPAAIGIRRFYQGVLIVNRRTGLVTAGTMIRLSSMTGSGLALMLWSSLPGAVVGGAALSCGVVAESVAIRLLARSSIKATLEAPQGPPALHGYPLFRFYLPLALTPLIGLSIHPMTTFLLGKGAFPLESMAIMPVLYALTFLFRALALSLPETAITLLSEDPGNRPSVARFSLILATTLTGALTLIACTPLQTFWFATVSGLSPALTELARTPLLIMAIFPALTVITGYQRSLLIVAENTTPVSLSTALETIGIFGTMSLLVASTPFSGVTCACYAYVAGRIASIFYLALILIRQRRSEASSCQPLPEGA